MKKTLIALAALTAGAAFAQSTVTLSGGIAAGFKHDASGATSVNTVDRFGAADNNITFTAVEDLGSGLKAGAVIQARFDPSNGRNRSTATGVTAPFAQNVKLSLSGAFGEVAAGRFNAPVDVARGAYDPFNGGDLTTFFAPDDTPTRYNGMLQYSSPSFSGLKVVLATSLKDNTAGATKSMTEGTVSYANGPLTAYIGYTQNSGTGAGALPTYKKDVTSLGAGYDFTVARVGANYSQVKADAANGIVGTKRLDLGVFVPVGANVIVRAGYENFNSDAANSDFHRLGAGVDYILSKRTKVMFDIAKRSSDAAALDDRGYSYILSTKHTF